MICASQQYTKAHLGAAEREQPVLLRVATAAKPLMQDAEVEEQTLAAWSAGSPESPRLRAVSPLLHTSYSKVDLLVNWTQPQVWPAFGRQPASRLQPPHKQLLGGGREFVPTRTRLRLARHRR